MNFSRAYTIALAITVTIALWIVLLGAVAVVLGVIARTVKTFFA